jgi:hypothetical protein
VSPYRISHKGFFFFKVKICGYFSATIVSFSGAVVKLIHRIFGIRVDLFPGTGALRTRLLGSSGRFQGSDRSKGKLPATNVAGTNSTSVVSITANEQTMDAIEEWPHAITLIIIAKKI